MLIVGLLSWWYSTGWKHRVLMTLEAIDGISDFFSISLLIRSLFSPFRQISAGRVSGPIGVQFRAFFDQLISRIIGAIVRSFLIVAGLSVVILYSAVGVVVIVGWGILPLLPVIGAVLSVSGWIPSWT